MDSLNWIKDLVLEEQEKEQQGLVDVKFKFKTSKTVTSASVELLKKLKSQFSLAAETYNSIRRDSPNQIKVYGVSSTLSDFMLFRNNIQLIFSLKEPGVIHIYSAQLNASILSDPTPGNTETTKLSHVLRAKWGAFDLQWTFQDQPFQLESLVRYYFSLFIKMSSNH